MAAAVAAARPASAGGYRAGGRRAAVVAAARHGGGGPYRPAGGRGRRLARRSLGGGRAVTHSPSDNVTALLDKEHAGGRYPPMGGYPSRPRRLPPVRAAADADAAAAVGGAPPTPASDGHVGDRRHRRHGRIPSLLRTALPLVRAHLCGAGRAGDAHPQSGARRAAIFRRVKIVLSFRKSRVFSQTCFQCTCSIFAAGRGVRNAVLMLRVTPRLRPPGHVRDCRPRRASVLQRMWLRPPRPPWCFPSPAWHAELVRDGELHEHS